MNKILKVKNLKKTYHTKNEETLAIKDVNFELDDGSKWCAEFFTYKNLITISQKNRHTGECLAGQYFQSNKAIFISKMNKDLIVSVLNEIIQNERDLTSVFTAINN